jgi:Fic family protein
VQSFAPGFLEAQSPTPQLVTTIRALGEHKGKEQLFTRQSPQVLDILRRAAVIESTRSSNRIEGIVASDERVEALVEGASAPRNRSEQEIAGYRDVLATIHASHDAMPFTPNVVLQLHRDLYRFATKEGGRFKPVDNQITETRPDGAQVVRFRPVPAADTPRAMDELHLRFRLRHEEGVIEPLLLIASYVLDFLCIHPFLDGNGRMARLLTLLLLYKEGYGVGRYISLERIVESQRDGYYDTLFESSQGWHQGRHTLLPWWEYFLGVVLLTAYRELEGRTGRITSGHGAKSDLVERTVEHLPYRFRLADVLRACPGVSRPTINRVLQRLRQEGRIELVKSGRAAAWEKREWASL